jgi:hypothetical protein
VNVVLTMCHMHSCAIAFMFCWITTSGPSMLLVQIATTKNVIRMFDDVVESRVVEASEGTYSIPSLSKREFTTR